MIDLREVIKDALDVLERHDCSLYYAPQTTEEIENLVERLRGALGNQGESS